MTHNHPMLGYFTFEIPEEKIEKEKIEKNLELNLFV